MITPGRIAAIAAALCLAATLCACGQKGPLRMPEPPAPAAPAR